MHGGGGGRESERGGGGRKEGVERERDGGRAGERERERNTLITGPPYAVYYTCMYVRRYNSLAVYYLSVFRLLCPVELPIALVTDPLWRVVAEVGQSHSVLGTVITKYPPTSSVCVCVHVIVQSV